MKKSILFFLFSLALLSINAQTIVDPQTFTSDTTVSDTDETYGRPSSTNKKFLMKYIRKYVRQGFFGDITVNEINGVVTLANGVVTSVKLATNAVDSTKAANLSPNDLAQTGASTGQALVWTGSKYAPRTVASGGTSILPDTFGLPEIKEYVPAVGITANESVTNYTPSSLDANRYKLSTTRFGSSGSTEYGGWLANGTSGDSVSVTAPFGVVIGDSQAEGHPGLHGRLHPRANIFQATYPDSVGQLSYHLRQLTRMRWYNQGIGGETSRQTRARFYRDALGFNSNPNDGRGSVATIPGKPFIICIATGINDVFAGYTNDEIIENLRWMAATCNDYGVKCVVLNLPGDEIISQTQARNIEVVNKFLNEGGLDPYNAVVVDYNKWWKDPAYNSLNVATSLIVDDIHPSKVGYDSLANYIFREANLPILSKLVVSTERDPSGFSGFSRPNSVNLNGVTYAVAATDIDTLEITNVLKDTVWVKINSSTNVTGTTYSGFSHLQWFLTNNPQNKNYYTKRKYYAAPIQRLSSTSLILRPTGYEGQNLIDARFADNNSAFTINVSGGLTAIFGNGSGLTQNVRVYGSLGTTGVLTAASGQNHQIGSLQILSSGFPSGTGAGITAGIEALRIYFGSSDLEFGHYSGNSSGRTWASTSPNHVTWRSGFAGTLTTNGLIATYHNEIPTLNMVLSGGVTTAKYAYRRYNPTLTALPAGIQHVYIENVSGDNLFNTTSGNTGVGNSAPLAKLHVTGDCIITSTIWHDAAKTVGTFTGTGTPESAVTASVGSVFHRTDGGAGTSFYVKESGSGNTGWVPK